MIVLKNLSPSILNLAVLGSTLLSPKGVKSSIFFRPFRPPGFDASSSFHCPVMTWSLLSFCSEAWCHSSFRYTTVFSQFYPAARTSKKSPFHSFLLITQTWILQRGSIPTKSSCNLGVSKNRGILPPKWMVYFMENPIEMGWFGGTPIFGNIHLHLQCECGWCTVCCCLVVSLNSSNWYNIESYCLISHQLILLCIESTVSSGQTLWSVSLVHQVAEEISGMLFHQKSFPDSAHFQQILLPSPQFDGWLDQKKIHLQTAAKNMQSWCFKVYESLSAMTWSPSMGSK